MPRYRHPRAADDRPGAPPARIHISRAESATVDADGEFEAPEPVGAAVARQHGVTEADIRVGEDAGETCDAVKSDGEVCGRELPCPYHSEGDG